MNNAENLKFLQNRLNDYIRSYNRNGRPVITDFLSVFEQKFAAEYLTKRVPYEIVPADESSISRCFAIPYYDGQLVTLRGTIRNAEKPVTQRNVYGALMGLNIEPEKFGDVWMEGNTAYVDFEILDEFVEPRYVFDRKRMTVSSMRVDAIVKAASGVSREDAQKLVTQGHVKLNHEEITSPTKTAESGDILSVRGYGRYKILSADAVSRSGRIAVYIDKFK